jgi:hypothetical protein
VDLPEDAESKLDWNWLALSQVGQSPFGLSLQDKDLRKHDRDSLAIFLLAQAKEGMARWDLKELDNLLDPQFPQKSLAWLGELQLSAGTEVRRTDGA